MNTEKINAAASWYSNSEGYGYSMEPHITSAFTAGIHYAVENPDVIGCVTVEEAMRFAEWLAIEFWMNEDDELPTTEQLFDIFKQQKP